MTDALEAAVQRLLSRQPPLAAPASLEARVWAEIARREQQPWWQRSFLQWPLVARALYAAVAVAAAMVSPALWRAASGELAPELSVLRTLGDAAVAVDTAGRHAASALPDSWLLTGLLAVISLYAILFGVCAAGVALHRQTHGIPS